MFDRKSYADMRRAGMGIGVSKTKLVHAMTEILLQLPKGTTNLKDTIVSHLGMIGQMTPISEINAAWNDVKKRVAKDHPEKFILNDRKVLLWNDESITLMDKKISSANYKKLNELADQEHCSVNQIVTKIIRFYIKEQN
jgi:hypothetical protein